MVLFDTLVLRLLPAITSPMFTGWDNTRDVCDMLPVILYLCWSDVYRWGWDKTSLICFAVVRVTANLSPGLMLGAGGDTMTPKWTRLSMWTRSRSCPFITSSFQFQLGAGDWGEWQKRWLHLHLRAPAPVGSMDYLTEFVIHQNIFYIWSLSCDSYLLIFRLYLFWRNICVALNNKGKAFGVIHDT